MAKYRHGKIWTYNEISNNIAECGFDQIQMMHLKGYECLVQFANKGTFSMRIHDFGELDLDSLSLKTTKDTPAYIKQNYQKNEWILSCQPVTFKDKSMLFFTFNNILDLIDAETLNVMASFIFSGQVKLRPYFPTGKSLNDYCLVEEYL